MKDMFVVFVLFCIIGFYPNSVRCCINNTELVKVADEVNITFDLDTIRDSLIQINHGKKALFIGRKGSINSKFNTTDFKIVENSHERFSFMIETVKKNDEGSYCPEPQSEGGCCTNLAVTEITTSKSPVENEIDSEATSDGNSDRNQTGSGDRNQTRSGDDGKTESMHKRPGDGKGGSVHEETGDGNGGSKQTGAGDGKSGSKETRSGDGNNGIIPGVIIMLLTVIIVIISIVFYKKYRSRKKSVEPLNTKTNDRNGIYINYKKQINYLPASTQSHLNVEDLIYADLSLSESGDIIHSNIECVEYGQIDFTKVAPVQSINVQYDSDGSSESE